MHLLRDWQPLVVDPVKRAWNWPPIQVLAAPGEPTALGYALLAFAAGVILSLIFFA